MSLSQSSQIIGFCGRKGSGKSTAAQHLVSLGWRQMSFADPIRAALLAIGVPRENLVIHKEDPIPRFGQSARHMMQTLGTEWGRRMIHPDIWVSSMEPLLRQKLRTGCRIVIDDVRYPNEAQLIRDLGGRIFHVRNPRTEPAPLSRWGRFLRRILGRGEHSSEAGLPCYLTDEAVINTGTREDLYRQVEKLL